MENLKIDSNFWKIFPEATVNVLTVDGLDNHVSQKRDEEMVHVLKTASEKAQKYLTEEEFSKNEIVKIWREAFTKFKKKKGARASIEALLKRVSQGRSFQPINPLVDLYNSISLEFGVPCGGEDLDKIEGSMHLGIAKGGEAFRPLGEEKDEPALSGEVIYYDEQGAICRCLNWRDAQRTMLTETTKRAILVIEALDEAQQARAFSAIESLNKRIFEYFGVSGNIEVIKQEEK